MTPELKQAQIAVFFRDSYGGSFEPIMKSIQESFGAKLKVNTIPLPDEAPAEIPRLELSDDTKNISFSKNRADFSTKNPSGISDNEKDNFLKIISGLSLSIKRIGVSRQVAYIAAGGVSDSLLDKNLRLENLNNDELVIKEATWRINRGFSIQHGDTDFPCNNITQISYGRIDGDAAILLIRDVNTMQDKDLGILNNLESVKNIVANLNTEAESDFGIVQK